MYEDDAMWRARAFEWHSRFKEGRMWRVILVVVDLPQAGLKKIRAYQLKVYGDRRPGLPKLLLFVYKLEFVTILLD